MNDNGKLVIIYPIPRESAQGLHNAENASSGIKLQKNKSGREIDTKFLAAYSIKLGQYKTGLYKPWLENGKQKIENGELLTLQDYYEKKHRKEKGYYTSQPSDLKMIRPEQDEKRTYMEQLLINLKDGATVLDLSIPDDEIRYEIILEDHRVANSEQEYRMHKWPKAEFYIALEQEDAQIKYSKTLERTKAISTLHDSDFTLPFKRIAVSVLGISNTRTNLTEAQVYNFLTDFIEERSSSNSNNIGKYNEVFNLIKTPKGKIELDARYLLAKAIDYRSVLEKQGSYTWVRNTGPIVLGETYTEAVDFLCNPKKTVLIEELQTELKIKGEDSR